MATRVLVTQHGARGDGRADDGPAIQKALSVAANHGAELVFPPGRYRLGAPVALPEAVDLRLLGVGATLVTVGGSALVGVSGVGGHLRVQDLSIEGQRGASGAAIALKGSAWASVELERVVVRDFDVGLLLQACVRARVLASVVRGSGVGIQLSGGDGIGLESCLLEDNGVDLVLGTGAAGLAAVHLAGNRLSSAGGVAWLQEGTGSDGAPLEIVGVAIGPGDVLEGELRIPSFARNTVLFQVRAAGVIDEGRETTILGVEGVEARVAGRAVSASAGAKGASLGARSLAEFGDCSTEAAARATLDAALRSVAEGGGGILLVPADAPALFYPRNTFQAEGGAGALVVDMRGGMTRLYAPPLGAMDSQGEGFSSVSIERDIAQDLPLQGVYSNLALRARLKGGASSTNQRLIRDVAPGSPARLYVETHQGLFVGQTLNMHAGAGEVFQVLRLGLDGTTSYIEANLSQSWPAGTVFYNKNVVNTLDLIDISNCDNQSASLNVDRRAYGNGDQFGVSVNLTYQGDVMSAGGDEGGNGFTVNVQHDIDGFAGTVESWDPTAYTVTYQPGATHPHKLGTSRPLITGDESRWRRVTTRVLQQGYAGLGFAASQRPRVVMPAGQGVDGSLVGWFLAITSEGEYYDEGEVPHYLATAMKRRAYRWWLVTGVETLADGSAHVTVELSWWRVVSDFGATLLRPSNYTTDSSSPLLEAVFAPGAWVSDVRDGATGDLPARVWSAGAADRRLIRLAPSASLAATGGFRAGEPIFQPAGAFPWAPTGFRVRHFNAYPDRVGSNSYLAENLGAVQVHSALSIVGRAVEPHTLDSVYAAQKDNKCFFRYGIDVLATTERVLNVRAPVKDYAIFFQQPTGNDHRIAWTHANGTAQIGVDQNLGYFRFIGADVDLDAYGLQRVRGLSMTDIPAQNLRGINVLIKKGMTASMVTTVKFDRSEADVNYAVMIAPSYNSTWSVAAKRTDGFDVKFGTTTLADQRFDWLLVR